MASKTLIDIAIKLGKQLGANTSKFLGTKSNVTFMGPGPKDGMLFQKAINPESFASIGIEKVLPDIETSLGYAVGGKLNDIQLNKLIDNMSMMSDIVDPLAAKNVVNASSRFGDGLESLRIKSSVTDRPVKEAMSTDSGQRFIKQGDPITAENFGTSQFAPGNASKVGLVEEAGTPFKELKEYRTNVSPEGGSGLMAGLEEKLEALKQAKNQQVLGTVDRNDLPGKTARAREFLVNTLKVGDDSPVPTLRDIIDPADMKFILEGGGGTSGDPIVLVEKYFGPRIAEMIPATGTTEEIAIFTKRILNNVEDAKGLKPSEEGFDRMTARIQESVKSGPDGFPFADGGIARINLRLGGAAKGILKKINKKMIKAAADDIFATDDYKYDAEMVVESLVENNPKLFKNLLADDLDDALRSELYGLAVTETGTRAAMKIRAGKMERPLFDENGNLNKDAVLASASKYEGLDGRRAKSIIPKDEYAELKNDFNKEILNMSPEQQLRDEFPGISDRLIRQILTDNNPQRIAEVKQTMREGMAMQDRGMGHEEIIELFKKSPRTKHSHGGLAKILEI